MVVHRASQIFGGSWHSTTKSANLSYQLTLGKGFIHPTSKGLFSFLPIGKRVLDKLVQVVEDELNAIGAQKIELSIFGAKELWDKTNRWDRMKSEIFRVIDRNGKNYCLQPTAEEMVTQMVSQRGTVPDGNFPLMLYQTGMKYRDEMNPKLGLLRTREFIMNDLYSFHLSAEESLKTYDSVSKVYDYILRDILKFDLHVVEADSGLMGGNLSHEYHVPSTSGEDRIFTHHGQMKDTIDLAYCKDNRLELRNLENEVTAIDTVEIGHTFQLGTLFTEVFGVSKNGNFLHMNCYGLGIGRILAAAVDSFSAEDAIRVPEKIAPYKVALITPNNSKAYCSELHGFTTCLLKQLEDIPYLANDILFDDRIDKSYGFRIQFASSIGVPHIIVVGNASARSFEKRPLVEYMRAEFNRVELTNFGLISHSELFDRITELMNQ